MPFSLMILLAMFDDAISEAKALDEEFKKSQKLRGPLHGVPFSVKDCCEC